MNLILNKDRGNILSTSRNNQLFDSACNGYGSIIKLDTDIPWMHKPFIINNRFGFFFIFKIAHKTISPYFKSNITS